MKGYTFKRQRPILNYIADFACLELLLVIEIDGITHESEEVMEKDRQKEQSLQAVGFTVLRFTNWEVLHRVELVSTTISEWIEEREKVAG